MKTTLKLFVIPKERVPKGPPEPPIETEIEAPSLDGLLVEARSRLQADGYRIRTLSFAPNSLLAYVEATD